MRAVITTQWAMEPLFLDCSDRMIRFEAPRTLFFCVCWPKVQKHLYSLELDWWPGFTVFERFMWVKKTPCTLVVLVHRQPVLRRRNHPAVQPLYLKDSAVLISAHPRLKFNKQKHSSHFIPKARGELHLKLFYCYCFWHFRFCFWDRHLTGLELTV